MTDQLERAHTAALRVQCPYCSARIGHPCRVSRTPHPSRISLAREQHHWESDQDGKQPA